MDPSEQFSTAVSREVLRQQDRLPSGYKPMSIPGMSFDPRLAFELALRIDPPEEVFNRYGVDAEQAVTLLANPTFAKVLKAYADDVREHGLSFRNKARIQAEDLLVHSYEIATDAEQPASVRAELIKWTAKMADLEPKPKETAATGNGFNLQIVFSGEAKTEPLTIQGERLAVEQ